MRGEAQGRVGGHRGAWLRADWSHPGTPTSWGVSERLWLNYCWLGYYWQQWCWVRGVAEGKGE